MSWVVVGVAAAGALQGAANEKKNKRQHEYRAEAIKYSPWTGMGDPGVQEAPGMLESALKGAAMGSMIGGAGGGKGLELGAGQSTANMGNQAMGGSAALGTTGMSPIELQKWQMQNQAMGGTGAMLLS